MNSSTASFRNKKPKSPLKDKRLLGAGEILSQSAKSSGKSSEVKGVGLKKPISVYDAEQRSPTNLNVDKQMSRELMGSI